MKSGTGKMVSTYFFNIEYTLKDNADNHIFQEISINQTPFFCLIICRYTNVLIKHFFQVPKFEKSISEVFVSISLLISAISILRFHNQSHIVLEFMIFSDSSRLAKEFPGFKKVESVSEFGDEMSDRIYTIDSIHNTNNYPKANIDTYDDFMSSPKESSSHDDIEDPEVKKLYAKIQALEADRESMRQTLISMRTYKAQLVFLKEIAQHLCKEISPPSRKHTKKPAASVGSAFLSVFMIASLGYWRRKSQRNKHIFNALASNAGLLMLLDKGPQMGQWRCLSSTQV